MRIQTDDQIGVCSWSLQATGAEDLRDKVQAIGVTQVQLGLTAHRGDQGVWAGVQEILGAAGIAITSGMFSTVGEDYSSPAAIRVTGGVVPDQHWEANWDLAKGAAATASQMGLSTVMTHAGFLPHDPTDPSFEKLVGRLVQIARMFSEHGLTLNLETGQESAETLLAILGELQTRGAPNVAVNFDPANMILYDMDEPITALRQLAPHVRGVHVKDGVRTAVNTFARALNPLGAAAQMIGVFHPNYSDTHMRTAKLLGQSRAAIFKGGGGEAQRNPEKVCDVLSLEAGEAVTTRWPVIYDGGRFPWREETLDPARVADLWRGEIDDAAPLAAVTGTVAIALRLLGEAHTLDDAQAMAEKMWCDRGH